MLTGLDNYVAWIVSPDDKWLIATANRRKPDKSRLLRLPSSGGAAETILQPARMAQAHCARVGSRGCILSEDIDKHQVFRLLIRSVVEEMKSPASTSEIT